MSLAPFWMKDIPVVAVRPDGHITKDDVEVFCEAFTHIGFCYIYIPEVANKIPEFYPDLKTFFELPEEIKKGKYMREKIGYQGGFLPIGGEFGYECMHIGPGGSKIGDYKEAFSTNTPLPFNHDYYRHYPLQYPENIWPDEPQLQPFNNAMREMRRLLFPVGQYVARLIGLSLGLPDYELANELVEAPVMLRALWYPPTDHLLQEIAAGRIIWGCTHTDINWFTILPRATRSALWIYRREDGVRIQGHAPDGCVIAQAGNMLEHWTNRKFTSARHEVRVPDEGTSEGRLSVASFFHPKPRFWLRPQPQWQSPYEHDRIQNPPIRAYTLLCETICKIYGADPKLYQDALARTYWP